MERNLIGSAVFLAVFCGQPVLLGTMCLYLAFLLLCTSLGATYFRPAETG
ncbi:MAG: hypothetical protein AAF942_10925 [Pseudomonadota bacterium]